MSDDAPTDTQSAEVAEALLARVVNGDATVFMAHTITPGTNAELAERVAAGKSVLYQIEIRDKLVITKFLTKQEKYELAERISARWGERAARLEAELGGERPKESLLDFAAEMVAALMRVCLESKVDSDVSDALLADAIAKAKRLGIELPRI